MNVLVFGKLPLIKSFRPAKTVDRFVKSVHTCTYVDRDLPSSERRLRYKQQFGRQQEHESGSTTTLQRPTGERKKVNLSACLFGQREGSNKFVRLCVYVCAYGWH